MKWVKYIFLSTEINHGTEENPNVEQILIEKSMGWSEANEEIAKREAYNGEYTIEDDGYEEPGVKPSEEERIAELEQALYMILNGVTE